MSSLLASAARRRISPSDQLITLWNKSAPKPYSPVNADIYVQALAFSDGQGQTLLHVGGDIINTFGSMLTSKLAEEFKLNPDHIFYSCTHNHMVPDIRSMGGGGFGVGEGAQAWADFVMNGAIESVRDALATLRPARIGAGHGVSGISVNREWDTPVGSLGAGDRNGETFHQISVLRVDEVGGAPIAVMVNGNCHAGSFFGGSVGLDHRVTGGDVAGFVSQFVGNAIGRGVVPIWAIGGAGDQNTYFHSGMMWPSVDDKGQFYMETYIMQDDDAIKLARNIASIQALEALDIYNAITEFSQAFDLKAGVTYRKLRRVKYAPRTPGTPGGGPAGARIAGGSPPGAGPAGPPQSEDVTLRFYLITLNGIAFAGANSETFVGLKKAALNILPYDEKFWIDMNSDDRGSAGYIPSPSYDPNYDGGARHNLQGALLPFDANEALKLYSDGMDELVRTIA